jgi:hypothetical protein
MFMPPSRRNPTSVWSLARANSTGRLDGAEAAQLIGIRAVSDFCNISNEARPMISKKKIQIKARPGTTDA